jgi:hypothetical protein
MEMNPTALERIRVASRPEIARLSVTQFHRMIELGILPEGEPIELIDGILVRKDNSDTGGDPMTHGPKHAFCVQRLKDLEGCVKPYQCHLRQQPPIILSDNREPEPDIVLVRGTIDDSPVPSATSATLPLASVSTFEPVRWSVWIMYMVVLPVPPVAGLNAAIAMDQSALAEPV